MLNYYINTDDLFSSALWQWKSQAHVMAGHVLPGEEGGEGKVVHSRRGRVTLRGAQIEEV